MAIRDVPDEALALAPVPVMLLEEPLEFIFAEHARQRSLCAALVHFASSGKALAHQAQSASRFLQRDMPLHHRDEDEDLFPHLRRRALAQDELGPTLDRLGHDHRLAEPMEQAIIGALGKQSASRFIAIAPGMAELMRTYSASEQRHLAQEDAIILSIARIRLTRGDLKAMSQSMKLRRGL
jgi:hemerythrin-like domain-containing protein